MASLPISIPSFVPLSRPRSSVPRARVARRINREGSIRAHPVGIEPFYDDRSSSAVAINGFVEAVDDLASFDHGPPRWFCPLDCGPPAKDAPVLLFLPGIDGIGLGLYMHHKDLGRIFEVRCMHIPFCDRTPFKGLIHFVEEALRLEHSISQTKPIYLIGHSFGGCLALSVAARNPNIDLILILSNPATSIGKSKLMPFLDILRSTPYKLEMLPFLLSFNIGNHVNIALSRIESGSHPLHTINKLPISFLSVILHVQNLLDKVSSDFVSWKLELLESAAHYANSRLHAVKAEVLVLASCMDSILPSRDEAERLTTSLLNSKVYYCDGHGHSLLLETGLHLSTIIKVTNLYRHSRQHDHLTDYLPPTMRELEAIEKLCRHYNIVTSPVFFSTLEDGNIVRGLSGIPNEGPVLLVGNHMLVGLDTFSLVVEFLREKRTVLHGMAHPLMLPKKTNYSSRGLDVFDWAKVVGGIPVSSRNFYRLLSKKSYILLYPGGAREALHRKGEEYKLFWPVQPEFVRMASQFGATIVPFGVVGEDDTAELVLDYDDLMRMPIIRDRIKEYNEGLRSRARVFQDARNNQELYIPCVLPKIPGRFYYMFGKPIITRGKMEVLEDRESANALYLHVKSEIESIISYLLRKRKEDKHRSIFQRILFHATQGSSHQVPTFKP